MAYKQLNLGERIPSSVNKFLDRYRARVSVVDRQVQYTPIRYDFSARDYEQQYVNTYYQNVVQITMAEEDMSRLMEDAEYTEDLRRQYGPNIMPFIENAHILANQASAEQHIRKTNPGVQLAWEKYQLMLKIAGGE